MSEILLLSSGIDSFVAWQLLKRPPCLHFHGHSKYSLKELQAIIGMNVRHPDMTLITHELSWLQEFEESDANIVGRNGLFCFIAAYYGDTIYLPCQLGEQSIPDRNPASLEQLSNVLTIFFGRKKTIDIVFPTSTKQDLVKLYLDSGYPKDELLKCYSCESSKEGRCGSCKMCTRVAIALDYNNILPDNYFRNDIWKWEGWSEYISKIKAGKYEQRRSDQTTYVLQKRGLWK